MRPVLVTSLVGAILSGCGARTSETDPPPTAAACAPSTVVSEQRVVVNLISPAGAPFVSACEAAQQVTITDVAEKCTVASGAGAPMCDGHGAIPRLPKQLLLEGPGLLPTLLEGVGYHDGAASVTYVLPAVQESFLPYMPSFSKTTTAAVVTTMGASGDPCAGVVFTVEHPSAVVRYVGGGTETDATGFAVIEGAPAGAVTIRASGKCGAGMRTLALEPGAVSIAVVPLR